MKVTEISSLSPENWPFSLEFLPQPAYMVGGAVRDALLGRTREYLDLDFVLPQDAVQVARKIANYYKAGFVLLDAERQIARVVFPNATVDIAQQEGTSLATDLHRRDFTINAIAYNPHTQEIVDPLGGYGDLEQGILRMVSPTNLEDDPLRLMRGYRQAAQLGFTIEEETQTTIRDLASHIENVSAERVRVEVGYLLQNSQGTHWLVKACEDRLLTPYFKSVTEEGLNLLTKIDTAAAQISTIWQKLGIELELAVRDTVKTTLLGIAKLACIVNPNPETAEIELQDLTYSRAEIKAVITALKLSPQLHLSLSLREQYFFFQGVGFVFPATAVLAVARVNLVGGIAPLVSRYLSPDDPVAHPIPLVNGKDLIIALNIPASPVVGKILTEIVVAQVEGRIGTKDEAIDLAKSLLAGIET
ncbi:MAG: CCA tRNA nucleotidyltransferase [Scytonematopsis contorta HA4267-MV1]|jgi:tRNA nucleotidyltransferase (CCA-adding enzyme)|nr:CCA tRNA nucleotidyltransferase [Scytonematopsis contorta HA4267-MV1]